MIPLHITARSHTQASDSWTCTLRVCRKNTSEQNGLQSINRPTLEDSIAWLLFPDIVQVSVFMQVFFFLCWNIEKLISEADRLGRSCFTGGQGVKYCLILWKLNGNLLHTVTLQSHLSPLRHVIDMSICKAHLTFMWLYDNFQLLWIITSAEFL